MSAKPWKWSCENMVNKTQDVYIYGAGLTGIAIAEHIREKFGHQYEVKGFVDDKKTAHDYPVPIFHGGRSKLYELKKQKGLVHVVLGFPYPVPERLQTGLELLAEEFEFPSFYDPILKDRYGINIGRGVIVHPDAGINPSVTLRDFVGINEKCTIEASYIDEGVIITPGVFVGSGTSIGRGTLVRVGTKIMHGVKIGEYCDIGEDALIKDGADIGRGTTVGSRVTVKEGINVGNNCILTANNLVVAENLNDGTSWR